ncbi:UNVERIFIED_CONTAM: hypothetical protein Slati_0136700 [Sesamum latifolium]|uniref:Uncharacterized protein n=1 Tax=Sesamum latifolium TaxID=2727402 RepID=A0AAW2Y9F5_9LAMI
MFEAAFQLPANRTDAAHLHLPPSEISLRRNNRLAALPGEEKYFGLCLHLPNKAPVVSRKGLSIHACRHKRRFLNCEPADTFN